MPAAGLLVTPNVLTACYHEPYLEQLNAALWSILLNNQ